MTQPTRKSCLKDDIVKFVGDRGNVSFAELRQAFPQLAGGTLNLVLQNYPNIVLWCRLSNAGCDALSELLDDGRLEVRGCTPLVYHIDGAIPDLPLAKQKRHYKEPHWLPVVLNAPAP